MNVILYIIYLPVGHPCFVASWRTFALSVSPFSTSLASGMASSGKLIVRSCLA